MIVVTPSGLQYIYEREGDTMKLLDEIFDREHVALPSPAETRESRAAYAAQALAEIGNPAERVMRQEEPFWWQRENLILVPYNTDETIEEVAARMIGPPPDLVRDEKWYGELLEEYIKEVTEFTSYLRRLNERSKEPSVLYVPMPGWYSQEIHTPRGARIREFHSSGRTFLMPKSSVMNTKRILIERWNRLSPVEQRIEMALTATAGDQEIAQFDNIQPVDSALRWIADNNEFIEKYADNAGVPKELLEVILASEILYDYGSLDWLQDNLGRGNVTTAVTRGLERGRCR